MLNRLWPLLMISLIGATPLGAVEVEAERSSFKKAWFGPLAMDLAMDQNAPLRVRYLDNPARIIFEFETLDFGDLPLDFGAKIKAIEAVNFGQFGEGARLVLTFFSPHRVSLLDISPEAVDGGEGMHVEFESVSTEEFAKLAKNLHASQVLELEIKPDFALEAGLPLIVIDPGHGGVDPGAVRNGVAEKTITLNAAQIIKEELEQSGRYQVALTRTDDQFYSLLARRQFAERIGADLFLSIHADTVAVGDARGTTIYELSDQATSEIAAHFADFENRVDLFAGEFSERDVSDLSLVLTNMAHQASRESAARLARILQRQWQSINITPQESRIESAAFAVLKAPEFPSLLLEIGYISNDDDLRKIQDPNWLREMAILLLDSVDVFFAQD